MELLLPFIESERFGWPACVGDVNRTRDLTGGRQSRASVLSIRPQKPNDILRSGNKANLSIQFVFRQDAKRRRRCRCRCRR